MSKTPKKQLQPRPRSFWKGVVAGLVGGLVATAAKTYFDRIHAAHQHEHDELASPLVVATRVAAHALTEPACTATLQSIPWTFGAITGAAYGAAAELFPSATDKEGAKFGMMIAPLAATPLLADPQPADPAGFIVFGLITETVRGLIRRFW